MTEYRRGEAGIIRTIKQDMIVRELGTMSGADMAAIDDNLRAALNLI